MRGARVKLLRKKLVQDLPLLRMRYGRMLPNFKNIFRRVKRAYNLGL